jgi:hypothetical protein
MDEHCTPMNGNGTNGQTKPVFPPSLQKILLKSSLSMTNFTMHFALKLVFLLKLLIKSGKMLRETSRSKSWVE